MKIEEQRSCATEPAPVLREGACELAARMNTRVGENNKRKGTSESHHVHSMRPQPQPQRLKPYLLHSKYYGLKAVPFKQSEFFRSLFSRC